MIGKRFLIIFSLLCLGLIAYTSYDLLSKKNILDLNKIFGKEDQKVLIINRPTEFSAETVDFDGKAYEFIKTYIQNFDDKTCISISASRNQIHIIGNEIWTNKLIIQAFPNLQVNSLGYDKFQIGAYKAEVKKNILYLYEVIYTTKPLKKDWSFFDKKSTATIIDFATFSPTLTEIYTKSAFQSDYITQSYENTSAEKIDDYDLFATMLPNTLSNYHFYEKNLLLENEKTFEQSPIAEWVNLGLVVFEYKGKKVMISDYKSGQQADLIMQDAYPDYNMDVENLYPFKSKFEYLDFGTMGKIYLKVVEDYVILSEDNEVLNQVIADTKLGNTVAQSEKVTEEIFGNLPTMVSERFTTKDKKVAISYSTNQIFKTEIAFSSGININPNENSNALKIAVDGVIKDFVVFENLGQVASVSDNNKLKYFEEGIKKWEIDLQDEGKLLDIQLIDIFSNKKQQILLTFSNSVHIVDVLGRELNGFPVKPDAAFTKATTFYVWKGNPYLATVENNSIGIYDGKGGELNKIKTTLSKIETPVEVWLSNNTLFYGAADNKNFVMIDAKKEQEYRKFEISAQIIALKNPNQIDLFSLESDVLQNFDQKGVKISLSSFKGGKILKTFNLDNSSGFFISEGKTLNILNSKGIKFHSYILPFSNPEDVFISSINGKNYVAALDGIDNNVYLYGNKNGKKVIKSFEGSQKVVLSSRKSQIIVTTIVDNFIIQYIE